MRITTIPKEYIEVDCNKPWYELPITSEADGYATKIPINASGPKQVIVRYMKVGYNHCTCKTIYKFEEISI